MNYIDEFLLSALVKKPRRNARHDDSAARLGFAVGSDEVFVGLAARSASWTSAGVGAAILLHIAYCVLYKGTVESA